jgi:hypothetical protein
MSRCHTVCAGNVCGELVPALACVLLASEKCQRNAFGGCVAVALTCVPENMCWNWLCVKI